jgi:signal transduction histidine kinase
MQVLRRVMLRNAWVLALGVAVFVPSVLLFEQAAGGQERTWGWPGLGVAVAVAVAVGSALLAWCVRPLLPSRLACGSAAAVVRLPGRLAAAHVLAWTAAGVSSGLFMVVGERLRPDRGLMWFLACVLTGMAMGLVVHVRTRAHLGEVWLAAARQVWGRTDRAARRSAALGRRLSVVLGGVVFFSSGFGLYSSFALQREVVSFYVEKQAAELTARVEEQVRHVEGEQACEAVMPLAPAGGALLLAGAGMVCRAGVELPRDLESRVLAAAAGPLSVPSLDLDGIRGQVDGRTLVLLFAKPEWARRVLPVMLGFYTLLFLFCAHLAVQVARDLTGPLADLQRQVARIEQGDLGTPIAPVSVDEMGELAQSTEAMRRSLSEMVETIRSLNLTLEEKVAVRTRELGDANASLTDALRQLKEAQAQLVHAEKMASLGRLMAGLAHELNNPVNAVVNSLGPLADGLARMAEARPGDPATARLVRAAGVAAHAADRTVDLIRSLKTFSRAHEETAKPCDLNAAVEATLLLLQHRVEAQGMRVERRFGSLPPVPCRPGEVGQVLMNLLANAVEAVEPLGAQGRVVVETAARADGVSVSVTDNGAGIPREHLSRIFEPFFTTKEKGTGLGLAIAHQVVDRHGGSLTVASGAGGTTFTVTLPLTPGGECTTRQEAGPAAEGDHQ